MANESTTPDNTWLTARRAALGALLDARAFGRNQDANQTFDRAMASVALLCALEMSDDWAASPDRDARGRVYGQAWVLLKTARRRSAFDRRYFGVVSE